MSKRATVDTTPMVRRVPAGYGQTADTFTVTYPGMGTIAVRFHGTDRASVSDVDSDPIAVNGKHYTLRYGLTRTTDGWQLDDRGTLWHRDGPKLWQAPAPTIGRRILAAARDAVTVVAKQYPDVSMRAEVDRLTREHNDAVTRVRELRTQLADAERAEYEAATALAYAELAAVAA